MTYILQEILRTSMVNVCLFVNMAMFAEPLERGRAETRQDLNYVRIIRFSSNRLL